MVTTLGGALFGGQLGQALGSLAAEVLSAGDIGLPLGPAGTAALIPANIKEYGEGLELPDDEVRLYVALREAAHQRLFEHVPWLRGHMLNAVETYANGITVNREAIEEAMGRIDPTNPESMQELALEGIFTPEDTPAQKAVAGPAGDRARAGRGLGLPRGRHAPPATACPTWCAWARRSAAAGPPVVRPSRPSPRWSGSSCARAGCARRRRCGRPLTEHRGIQGRDALWGHPDLLPSDDDFADPDGVRPLARRQRAGATSTTSATWASTSRAPKAKRTRAPTLRGLPKSPSRPRSEHIDARPRWARPFAPARTGRGPSFAGPRPARSAFPTTQPHPAGRLPPVARAPWPVAGRPSSVDLLPYVNRDASS